MSSTTTHRISLVSLVLSAFVWLVGCHGSNGEDPAAACAAGNEALLAAVS